MRKSRFLVLVLVACCFSGLQGSAHAQQTVIENGRKLVRRVDPQYPQVAKRMNLGGTVKVVAVVAADGSVRKVEPLGGSPILVQAAQSAVTQWKFVSGTESRETIELRFTP